MPMIVSKTAGGDNYANPFVGPVGPSVAIDCDISLLTTAEVDLYGYIKAGVPLTAAGKLIGVDTISTIASGVAHQNAAGSVGNGTIGAATGGFDTPAETITVTMTGSGATAAFSVDGSKSGHIGVGAVGTAFVSQQINFTISDGSTDWAALNTVTYVVTAGVNDRIYGVTIEPTRLGIADNTDANRVGTFAVAVAVSGLVNRDVVEDILGRVLTAAEITAFADSSGLQLTNT